MTKISLPFTLTFLTICLLSFTTISGPRGYVVGDIAEDFSLKNVNGEFISLRKFPGGPVNGYIVVFTCNHCPYAQLYEQRIIDLHNKFAPLGYPVVAINPNSPLIVPEDSYEEMQLRAKEYNYPFHYLFDEEQTVYPRFGATRTPHVYVLDSTLMVRYIGAIDDNPETPEAARNRWVERAIDSLRAGKSPNPDFTRAVGCTVKKAPPRK